MQNQKGYTLAGKKVFFGIPAYDHKVSLKQAISLMQFAQEAPPHGIQAAVGSICGCSVVSRARNLLVADFLESDATELMFIDADINFDPQDIFRLSLQQLHDLQVMIILNFFFTVMVIVEV